MGTGMGRPQVTRRKPRPVGRVWRVFKWCGRGVEIAVVELQPALSSVALGAAAVVATSSSLVLAAVVAAVVAGVVLIGTWCWQLQLQLLLPCHPRWHGQLQAVVASVILVGVGSCSCCCRIVLVGVGSCSCCCRQCDERDDEWVSGMMWQCDDM